jgi:hypothetical protein
MVRKADNLTATAICEPIVQTMLDRKHSTTPWAFRGLLQE